MPDERQKNPEQARREERLAEALRENLRRRKARARARERAPTDDAAEPEPGRDR